MTDRRLHRLRRNRRALVASALAALLCATACAHRVVVAPPPPPPAAPPAQERAAPGRLKKEVLAFYYGWYGNPRVSGAWMHWAKVDEAAGQIGTSTHYPQLGPYDSQDPKIVEQHVRWARDAGITGLIVSWWHQRDFHDRGMPMLLDAAQRAGLHVTIYFEDVKPHDTPTVDGAVDDLMYVLDHYGRHPAWLTARGKPVVFVYARALGQLKLDGWQTVHAALDQRYPGGVVLVGDSITAEAARVFDGIHTYNPTGATAGKSPDEIRAWANTTYPRWVETAGADRIACITVLAGYDDSRLGRKAPRPITDRHDGDTYRILWQQAIAANPDWILICSWNEWHEGSEIEPSVENGNRELTTTAGFAARFQAAAPRVPDTSRASGPAARSASGSGARHARMCCRTGGQM